MRAKPPSRPARKAAAAPAPLGPEPSEKVTTGNPYVPDHESPPAPKPPHPCAVGLDFARANLIAPDGDTRQAGAWLAKNYPHHFPDADSARAALAG